jgi:hypothetical protein
MSCLICNELPPTNKLSTINMHNPSLHHGYMCCSHLCTYGLSTCVSQYKHILVHLGYHSITKTKLGPFTMPTPTGYETYGYPHPWIWLASLPQGDWDKRECPYSGNVPRGWMMCLSTHWYLCTWCSALIDTSSIQSHFLAFARGQADDESAELCQSAVIINGLTSI